MGRWADIVTDVKQTVGTTSDADAKRWIIDAARRLNSEAEYLTAPVNIGPTVAGQSDYPLGQVIDLAALRVGSTVYQRVSSNDMWSLEAGTADVQGESAFFAADYSSTGDPLVQLFPTPQTAGLAVEGRMVIRIADPDWVAGDPPLPEDFDTAIVHGAVATGLARADENLADAQWHEERFVAAALRLRRRKNSRVGSGPVRMQVQWR